MSPFVFRTYVLQVKHLVRYGDPVGPLENLWSMICAVESSSFMQSIVKGMTWQLDYTGMKHHWFIFLFFFVLDLYLYANVKCLFKILKRWTVYIWGIVVFFWTLAGWDRSNGTHLFYYDNAAGVGWLKSTSLFKWTWLVHIIQAVQMGSII